jgi:tRNA pseudouridine13 synthase
VSGPARWPYLTAALPGCGGAFKLAPEDFEVEELPAYLPTGEGEHLYLWVEKRGRDTQEVVRALALQLRLPESEVGYAGLKDRQAVTRQFLSVPARANATLPDFALPGVAVLFAQRHRNKLRTGHLKGNRFGVRLRGLKDEQAARDILAQLGSQGVPNYFGDQRFGRTFENAELGKRLLLGERLPRAPRPFERKLYLSAYQSLLFNRLLAERIAQGTFARALLGEVLRKEDSGGLFVCEHPEIDQPRVDGFEVSPAGPMFGPKMPQAHGPAAQAEAAALAQEGLGLADFARGRGETLGARRSYRARLALEEVRREGEDLWLRFCLPRGSYATSVLRALLKANPPPAAVEEA